MKKILCLIFALLMMFCAVSCKPEAPGGEGGNEPGTGLEQDNTPVVDGKWIVKEGETEYYILIPDNASATIQNAATELAFFFNKATNINLSTKTNSEYSQNGKYISFGNTTPSSSVTVTKEELGTQGFKIVTVGDNIIVKAVGDHGLLWGSYELLTRMFNYEYYAKDVYYIDTKVADYPLKSYNVTDRPDIEVRAVADSQGYSNSEVAHRLRQFQVYDEFLIPSHAAYHNSFYYVMDGLDANNKPIVPSRFLATNLKQLCFTGGGDPEVEEEMLNRSLNYLIDAISKSDKSDIILGVMDEDGWCQCSACDHIIQEYGAKSATMILFINKLRDKLDAYLEQAQIGREINIYYTAYFDIVQPPVHKENGEYVANDVAVKLKDGVGVLFAPINSNFTQSIYDKVNEATYEQLKSLKAITKKLLVWTYACNFTDFFAPYDSITYMTDWFEAIIDNNGTYLFNQGRHSQGNSSQFDALRQYLVAKLGWDVKADVNKLTNNFFDVYFGKAKAPMRQMYDELRTIMRFNVDVLGMSSGVLAEVAKEEYWPENLLNSWMELIDKAYELAGDDEVLKVRILRESIFVRYYQLKFYMSDSENIEDLRQQFIKDAMLAGIEKSSEHKAIVNAFS
ncbi:MAG: DUF4838 domain-containing protein [Clostridia bacterium]|nr:DUF4838 domain-containing protein [Clostridia bacterium]